MPFGEKYFSGDKWPVIPKDFKALLLLFYLVLIVLTSVCQAQQSDSLNILRVKFEAFSPDESTTVRDDSFVLKAEDVELDAGDRISMSISGYLCPNEDDFDYDVENNDISIGSAKDSLVLLDQRGKGRRFRSAKGSTIGSFAVARAKYVVSKKRLIVKLSEGQFGVEEDKVSKRIPKPPLAIYPEDNTISVDEAPILVKVFIYDGQGTLKRTLSSFVNFKVDVEESQKDFSLSISASGTEDGITNEPELSLSTDSTNVIVDGSIQLVATLGSKDVTDDFYIEYETSNEDVLSVDDEGLITGESAGQASVAAEFDCGGRILSASTSPLTVSPSN